jgi:RNA polymerase sigma-70 factor (ECF subfamily)
MIISTIDYLGNEMVAPSTEDRLADALERLRPGLTSRARAIVRDRHDAEDAVQEAAARAWRSRSTLHAGSDPAPWLRAIVTRVAIDLARERGRRTGPEVDESLAVVPSPEDDAMGAEVMRTIGAAAERLPAAKRRVFVLHDLAGFTSHEIAALDAVPYHTVRTRLHRARTALRNDIRKAI